MKVWLITGCSTGFGRELAQVAAEKGDHVAGTLRKTEQMEAFEALALGKLTALHMDVTDHAQVVAGVQKVLDIHGRIDVLVNNAGYGSIGPIEEVSAEEVQRQFDVNVFGALDMIRAVLPTMRAQASGHIINITSIAGLRGNAGLGIYNASKFALEGAGEALAKEVGPLGIAVTNVEPGPFRTEWAGRSATYTPIGIEDYNKTAARLMDYLNQVNGQQVGDPRKAAEAMYTLAYMDNPPVHLPMGAAAYRGARQKFQELLEEIDTHESLGLPTDFEV